MTKSEISSSRRGILILATIAIVLVLSGGAALIGYTWRAVDRQEVEQETTLVERTLARALKQASVEVASVSSWDAAYENTAVIFDEAWVERLLGSYYHTTFGHEITLVFDPQGRLGYVAQKGAKGDLAGFSDLASALTPVVRNLQTQELQRRSGVDPRKVAPNVVGRAVYVKAGSSIYLVGLSTIAPDNGLARGEHPTAVVATGWRVDRAFLTRIEGDLGIRDPHLAGEDLRVPGTVPITGPNGETLGVVGWSAEKQGDEVLRRGGVWIGLFSVLLGVTISALGLRVRRLFLILRANDEALQATMDDLVEARDLAETSSIAKTQFIANMSHEIRTPLNGVLGMAQALTRDDLTASQQQRVRTIIRSGEALLTVLNDVLDISKVEAGKIEINASPFDLADLIDSTCSSYADVGTAKGVELIWKIDPELNGFWLSDPARVRQILLNLVSNALKFTETGTVKVAASLGGRGVCIAVSDQGIGIPADKLADLFQKFSQVDSSATRRFGGTGLGLAISRELATLMGGDISVKSEEGVGSTFALHLPLERSAPVSTSSDSTVPSEAAQDTPLRILAAEDNATNQLVLRSLLEPLGAMVVLVEDGAAAVEAFETQAFDIVLMDIQMPVMNGVDATLRIRALEQGANRTPTPILALTANTLPEQVKGYFAAGMDGCVPKPLQINELYDAISSAIEGLQPDEAETIRA